jgi:hypothetical protein
MYTAYFDEDNSFHMCFWFWNHTYENDRSRFFKDFHRGKLAMAKYRGSPSRRSQINVVLRIMLQHIFNQTVMLKIFFFKCN